MDDEDVGIYVWEVKPHGADPITRLPEYVPSCKGKVKVPKDIDERKTPFQTPLVPHKIIFEGPRLARVSLLKLNDSDLTNHEKFSHLETEQQMHYIIDTTTEMTALELLRWLRGVDKAGLLNLLWVSHYNRTSVTVLASNCYSWCMMGVCG